MNINIYLYHIGKLGQKEDIDKNMNIYHNIDPLTQAVEDIVKNMNIYLCTYRHTY